MTHAISSGNGTFASGSASRGYVADEMRAFDTLPPAIRRTIALGTIAFGAMSAHRALAAQRGNAQGVAALIETLERKEMADFSRLDPVNGSHLRAGAAIQRYAPWRSRASARVPERTLRAIPAAWRDLARVPAPSRDWVAPVLPVAARIFAAAPAPRPGRVPFHQTEAAFG